MDAEQRYLDFARLGADWFWETDREDRFTYFSADRSQSGVDLAGFIGHRRRDLTVPDAENLVLLESIEAVVRARQPFRNMRYRAGLAKETIRWCEISGEPKFNATGEFEGYRGVGRDVSALTEAQRALQAKSMALEAIMRATPDGVQLFDNANTTLAINDQLYRILDIPSHVGEHDADRTYQSILHLAKRGEYGPGDPVEVTRERIDSMFKLIMEQRHFSYERQLTTGRWIEVRVNALEDGGYLSLYRDISDIKQREADLERQAALFATIVATLDGISVYDKDKRLTAWNDGFAQLVGIDPSLLRHGVTSRELLIAQARAGEFGPCDPEVEADRRLSTFYPTDRAVVTERIRPDGRVIELRRKPVPGGGWVATYIDITARKQAERALQELNATLESRIAERTAALAESIAEHEEAERQLARARDSLVDAVDSIDHNMILWDRDDRLVMYTRHLRDQVQNADKYFVVGRTFTEILQATVEGGGLILPDGETKETFLARRIAHHRAVDGSVITRHAANGRVLHISEHRTPSGGTVSLGMDVTERLRMEEQLREAQRMEAIRGLTGGLAHDLNNYLAAIMGNLDLLADRPAADPQSAKWIEGALTGVRRSAELTRSLLAFSRSQRLDPKVLDVGETIAEVTRLLNRTIGERIEVDLEVASDLWPVRIDAAQLNVSIVNLANNARDAMPRGGELKIAVRNAPAGTTGKPNGDQVLIEVSDTGSGMEGATLAQAFEPFFSTKGPGHGTGLGLSMVHGFVHQSGGTIALSSVVGRGTTVRIFLPRVAEHPPRQAAAPKGAGLARGTENILLVEDNDEVREAAGEQLTSLGYRFTAVETGEAAVNVLQARAKEFDLVLTDIVMPGNIDGLALARMVAQRWPELRVVLTTGFADDDGAMSEEFVVLRKPYWRADLARTVRAALIA
jgi:signal transduction histidine kinase